ncbi:hypothetical protein BJV78DRAFT_654572 [Lactifluus subvellereus]|nr:hypothetical protein BJV78DRAFT_654572 [Lactifluus subvellereus]
MSYTGVLGLKDVATNAQLNAFVSEPSLAQTCPTEVDGRYLLKRLYSSDSDSETLNWSRALDQSLIIRVVTRNCGTDTSSDDSGASLSLAANNDSDMEIGLPTAKVLFDIVWGLLPDFIRTRVTQWAQSDMEGAIANEITEYVKIALGLLDIPVPAFFVNAVANLVIPPLVAYIVKYLTSSDSTDQSTVTNALVVRASLVFPHTAKSLKVMKEFDRRVLLAAGLNPLHLPSHLILTASNDQDSDSGSNSDSGAPKVTVLGQPDSRDCHTDLQQFYQYDVPNGCKPLQLMQVIGAQIRTSPQSDPDPDTFGAVVWKSLDSDTQKQLTTWATASPPDRADIADTLYIPVRNLLQTDPYNVPSPILDAFTAMKVPEVTEWVIATR